MATLLHNLACARQSEISIANFPIKKTFFKQTLEQTRHEIKSFLKFRNENLDSLMILNVSFIFTLDFYTATKVGLCLAQSKTMYQLSLRSDHICKLYFNYSDNIDGWTMLKQKQVRIG